MSDVTNVTPRTVPDVTAGSVPLDTPTTVTADTVETVTRPSLAVSGERGAESGERRENDSVRSSFSGISRADRRISLSTRMGRTLTPEQFEAWRAFEASADLDVWGPTLVAWAERFPWPPHGDAAGAADGDTQRSILWRVIAPEWGGRPNDCATWIREAPRKATGYAVVAFVDRRWRRFMADVDDALGPIENEDPLTRQLEARTSRGDASRALTSIRDVLESGL